MSEARERFVGIKIAATMRACTTCGVAKALDAYEVTTKDGRCRRAVCKPCYSRAKAERAKGAASKRAPDAKETTPKPAACITCGKGGLEVAFKWRDDVKKGGWRNECNGCYNAKGYCDDYRKREREKDEVQYLARNAEVHLAWARRNLDKVREQQVKMSLEPNRKMKSIRTSAAARGVVFSDADAPAMTSKLQEACNYCAFVPGADEPLNGLDRVDASDGYTYANTVACCVTCNAMKACMEVERGGKGVYPCSSALREPSATRC